MKKSSEVSQVDIHCLERYETPPLCIALTGSHGLIGSRLTQLLQAGGHTVIPIPRDLSFEACDIVVNLAGENIAGRWSPAKKQKIYSSRIETTRKLVEKLSTLPHPPVLISASAVGYYGDRGSEPLDASCGPGKGFLSGVCVDWEREANKYSANRVVTPRFGAVLAADGGMLRKLLPLFRCGLGATIGSGKQYMSWIAIDDLVYQLYHIMMTPQISGALNLTSPAPVTNSEFTRTLARAVHRSAWFFAPAWLVRLALGELGEELLLASQRAIPDRLEELGGNFVYPELAQALEHLLT